MREPTKDKGRIEHMLKMCQDLEVAKQKHTSDEIANDSILFFGISKMIEIIGEAAYKVTKEFRENHPELPWRDIIGMRHILVHGYFTINPEVLWGVVNHDIPPMIPILEKYLREYSSLDI